MRRLLAIAAGALLLASCSFNFGGFTVTGYTEEGCDASEVRTMPEFTSISAAAPFNIYYIQSEESKVVVEGKEEFLSKVKTEVDKQCLRIELEKGTYHNLVLKVTVYSPVADEIRVSGSGNFTDTSIHKSDADMTYRISGSGDLYLNQVSTTRDIDIHSSGSGDVYAEMIGCKEFEVSMAGSGDVDLNGVYVTDFDLSIAGSGDANVKVAPIGNDADLSISGSGSITMDADVADDIEARIAGSGNMTLNGECNSIEVKISGSGDVKGNLAYKKISTECKGSGKVRL